MTNDTRASLQTLLRINRDLLAEAGRLVSSQGEEAVVLVHLESAIAAVECALSKIPRPYRTIAG
jgi:hypothetical protein